VAVEEEQVLVLEEPQQRPAVEEQRLPEEDA
jgi:hypothetical protein